ncbi:CCR4-NOT transcription complex subunit 1 [Acropora cervicornis]|uniref:CCR4-NOT transcription complex subunit 1 n=1 Tax=Acropora cervicornis TaxID=6130 RepID=A0AAD9PWP5_ACRCE|nr:CCR4-NOT transcription complex subunit 1 [Acropora cervicornis]
MSSCVDSLSLALGQISFAVNDLTKKNYKATIKEVHELIEKHGYEAEHHLFRCLFSFIDFTGDGKNNGKDFLQCQFLIQECQMLVSKPNFSSILCSAIETPEHKQRTLRPSSQLLPNMSRVLKLNKVQEVIFGLSLLHSSNQDLKNHAGQFVKHKLPDLLRSYIDADVGGVQEGGLTDVAIEVLHRLLTHVVHGPRDQVGVGDDQVTAFLETLKKDFPKERVPVVLSPLLYPDLQDISPDNVDECKNTLIQFGMMVKTMYDLGEDVPIQNYGSSSASMDKLGLGELTPGPVTWNVEVFVQALKETVPLLSWRQVIQELDYPEFHVPSREGLQLLFTACHRGLMEIFPVDVLYRTWTNTEGQLSWIQQILSNPDVFCFTDYPCHTVVIDLLKTAPEDDNRETAPWKSLNLSETLLRLAEAGHYETLRSPLWHTLRNELVLQLIPVFLANHPNSGSVLHYVWHGQGQSASIRQLVMQAMAEWYSKGDMDQGRLSRILDALSMLLNGSPFVFVIDLAALASRREYLKLDKWLKDKLKEHQEEFAQACVVFLRRRCPHLLGVSLDKELPKSVQLPQETVVTMLSCLQSFLGQASHDLADTISQMLTNHGPLVKVRPSAAVVGIPFKRQGSLDGGQLPNVLAGQLPSFPPHPLTGTVLGPSGGLEAVGTIGSVLSSKSAVQKPPSQLGQLPLSTPTATSSSGLQSPSFSSSQTPWLQQFHQSGSLAQSMGGSAMDNARLLAGLGIQKQLSGNSLLQQQQQSPQQQTALLSQPRNPADKLRTVSTADVSQVWPGMDQTFTKEVEDEANSYFQRIYNHPPNPTISIDEVLEMLKKFKDSPVKKERDIFLCMLRNLFEEYRFFPQYMALGIALRYVLEALRKAFASKMYMFGIAALDRFKTRLKDYPHYCQHLASIPHFEEFPPSLIEYIKYGQQSREPLLGGRTIQEPLTSRLLSRAPPTPSSASVSSTFTSTAASRSVPFGPNTPLGTSVPLTPSIPLVPSISSTSTSVSSAKSTSVPDIVPASSPVRGREPSIATANNIDTLLGATETSEIVQPPESVQDKVHFIFNNISQTNLHQKYLVMKRASIEPNFHQLYLEFMESVELTNFAKEVLKETYRNIKVLLQSDKVPANFSDRSLLKNLGHWLGLQTLARNKPILMKDLDVKSLIIEAYFKGQQEMLYVVPFVAKVIESSAKSKVFKPPNPWVMAIMSVLVELHQMPDLKEMKASELLKDPERLKHIPHQLSSPEKEKQPAVSNTSTPTPTGSSQQGQPPVAPPPPQYSYQEINVASLAGLAPHIQINGQTPLFQQHPHLKQFVRPAIERAVQELVHPVVERSIKICLTTAEMIVKKDFALDPEESRMRAAAHHMVRFMTAGMALITCRDPLQISISNNLRSNFLAALRGANQQQKDMIERAASLVSEENTELACAFIQKTAEFDLRRIARSEGRRYCDPVVLTYQAERMPEQIRLKVGGVNANQTAVYEEFARSIPGFQPPQAGESITTPPLPKPVGILGNAEAFMPDEVVQILNKCAAEIEQHLHAIIAPQTNQHVVTIHSLLDTLVQARISRDNMAALRLLHKAVEGLLEGVGPLANDAELSLRYRDCHLIVLRGLQDPRGYGIVFVCECPAELKFNVEAIDLLIRSHLLNMREFDLHLVQCIDNGHNLQALHFAIQLAKYVTDDKQSSHVTENDLYHTIEALTRIAHSRQNSEGLSSLLDSSHNGPISSQTVSSHHEMGDNKAPGGPTSLTSGVSSGVGVTYNDDPPGLHEKVEYLLREWVRLCHQPGAGKESEKAFSTFVSLLHQQGILRTDELITRFFRISTELCVEVTYRALADHPNSPTTARAKCYNTLDAYCRLIALLVRHSGDASNNVTKINLLSRVLGTVATVLFQDHEIRHAEFQQLPYHRIFIMLLVELNQPEPILEAINFQVLQTFSTVFHALRPSRAPGFAYAWLELISHRLLMSKLLLNTPQQKGWVLFQQLLIDLFKFLAPFLRNAELAKQTHLLYKGTLRVLLVLLHDFPEFLCDYHFSFCDVIPPNCIQMRNLILSAFPRNMRLPDPFTPNLKVDLLTDIAHSPRILTNFASAIQPASFKKDLDSYLKTRAPVTFLTELRSHLQVSNEPGTRYNVPLMNALVLYVGTQAITYIHSKSGTPSMSTITHSSHMDIFQNLAVDLDTEGRYLFLNAIANQLRYPNSHTHYFSCVLLYLFAEANTESIQEQITRVLLERLIVNRPHPWGLLITFIELIKNHQYKFWTHEFVHCAPEIEKLFESVARSCMQQKQAPPRETSENRE